MGMRDMKLAVDGFDLTAEGRKVALPVEAMIKERALLAAKWRAEEIERRILAGENNFTIDNVRYTVPAWHSQPIKRLRVEWARWKARR